MTDAETASLLEIVVIHTRLQPGDITGQKKLSNRFNGFLIVVDIADTSRLISRRA